MKIFRLTTALLVVGLFVSVGSAQRGDPPPPPPPENPNIHVTWHFEPPYPTTWEGNFIGRKVRVSMTQEGQPEQALEFVCSGPLALDSITPRGGLRRVTLTNLETGVFLTASKVEVHDYGIWTSEKLKFIIISSN